MVEADLIRRCRAGETACYEPLVRAYEAPALRIALGMLGDADDARDAVQDAFVKAYQSLTRYDEGRPFAPWFFRILRNRCHDALRSRKPKVELSVLDRSREALAADDSANPETAHERAVARERLWRALGAIADEHREVLVLKELEGFRYAEIAEILGVPEGTVASRLYHARKALKDALRAQGVAYPEEAE